MDREKVGQKYQVIRSGLMKKFHYYRREKKLSSSQALRQSQLELLKMENENYKNPYFWAGFAVYGGYAEF